MRNAAALFPYIIYIYNLIHIFVSATAASLIVPCFSVMLCYVMLCFCYVLCGLNSIPIPVIISSIIIKYVHYDDEKDDERDDKEEIYLNY